MTTWVRDPDDVGACSLIKGELAKSSMELTGTFGKEEAFRRLRSEVVSARGRFADRPDSEGGNSYLVLESVPLEAPRDTVFVDVVLREGQMTVVVDAGCFAP